MPRQPTSRAPARRAPNPSGVHFLTSARVAAQLVRSSGAAPGILAVELGAGTGALTTVLAATGAHVLAVERDPAFARRLERRLGPSVRVVTADLRSVPLPRRPFRVVANPPFSVTTALLRRLFGAPALDRADLLVEWGLAKRLTEPLPRTPEAASWAARFELRLVRRVPAGCFAPVPRVDAAHLAVRPVPELRGAGARRTLEALLSAAYAEPGRPAAALAGRFVPRRRIHRLLTSSGIDPPGPAGAVPARGWGALAAALTADPALNRGTRWPGG
jgi:23S rRNA (adenine-N6)-dimethyltransferase